MIRKLSLTSPFTTNIFQLLGAIKKNLRLFLWVLIPIVLWWTLKDLPFQQVGENISNLGFRGIGILIGVNALIFLLFSLRWWLILRAQGHRRSFLALAGYRLAGFGVTYFTPGPQFGGEPLQVHMLRQRERLSTPTAAASVTLDKLFELLANFAFLIVGVAVILFGGAIQGGTHTELIILPAFLLLLPSGYLVALWFGHLPFSWITQAITRRFSDSERLNQFKEMVNSTESQVAGFCQDNPLALLLVATLSIVTWILMVFEFGLMLRFLGVRLDLPSILTALTAARIAFLLPLPAGLGTLEAGQVMAMGLIGVNPVVGVSLSLLIRARDVLLGGIGLWLGGLLSR